MCSIFLRATLSILQRQMESHSTWLCSWTLCSLQSLEKLYFSWHRHSVLQYRMQLIYYWHWSIHESWRNVFCSFWVIELLSSFLWWSENSIGFWLSFMCLKCSVIACIPILTTNWPCLIGCVSCQTKLPVPNWRHFHWEASIHIEVVWLCKPVLVSSLLMFLQYLTHICQSSLPIRQN